MIKRNFHFMPLVTSVPNSHVVLPMSPLTKLINSRLDPILDLDLEILFTQKEKVKYMMPIFLNPLKRYLEMFRFILFWETMIG